MKISHPHIAYSDIPRLVKEGVIKVGTRVKACDDIEKYINGFGRTMPSGSIGKITVIEDERFYISVNGFGNWSYFCAEFFLDILEDEEEEATCKDSLQVPKPLSFDEPLTKEAVGRVVIDGDGIEYEIWNISIDGTWVYMHRPFGIHHWYPCGGLKNHGFYFKEEANREED